MQSKKSIRKYERLKDQPNKTPMICVWDARRVDVPFSQPDGFKRDYLNELSTILQTKDDELW